MKGKETKPEAEKQVEKTEPKPKGVKFSVAELRVYAREVFGVSQSTFDGATCGAQGDFTVDEMKKLIEDWLKEAM